MNKQEKIVIVSMVCIILFVTASYSFSPVSGYQSMTAEWYKVYWPNAQTGTQTFTKSLEGTTFTWNPDATGIDSEGQIPDGSDDLSSISGEVENPKFDRNIEYHDWWINDTVSASNPTGSAKHYEWAIDIYTMNVNFRAIGGSAYFLNPPQIWVELQNNFDSVFSILGAEFAASYIIYAQTENYTWSPDDAGWHIIQPTVGDFELMFLDGNIVTPPAEMEDGSNLDFDKLAPYSHLTIAFELTEFGTARFGSEPTVNMVVELNVLTVGRFDYVLTYVSGGSNQMAPDGLPGLFASMAAALEAGWSALMDGFAQLGTALFGPIITLAIITVCVIVIIIIWRRSKK